jgi:hypothetical protein
MMPQYATGCHVSQGMSRGTFSGLLNGRYVAVSGLRQKYPYFLYSGGAV